MSDHDTKVEAAPLGEQDLEQERHSENVLDTDANIAIPDDQKHDDYEAQRRSSDPQGKSRGKPSAGGVKHVGGGGSSKPGGPKK